jgi:hypothetical protein
MNSARITYTPHSSLREEQTRAIRAPRVWIYGFECCANRKAVVQPPPRTGKDLKMIQPQTEHHGSNPPALLTLFDLRDPHAVARLHRERTGWQRDSDIERLGPDHAVLLVYAGGARRLAQ